MDIEEEAIVGVAINADVTELGSINKLGFILATRDNHDPEQEKPAVTEFGKMITFGDMDYDWYRQFPTGLAKL